MLVSCRKYCLFFFGLLFLPSVGFPLSDNNVRVHRFKWMTVQTPHFDIYYDQGTERMVPAMAKYLEGAWAEVGKLYQFQVPGRTPFFFYSNHNEFEQTNIVAIGEGTGGVTEAFKNRFLIFNDGSETWLRHVIYHEFTHVIQFNVLYGGFWKSIRLLKSPFYPLWLMEGLAELGSGDIDAASGDMVVRDAFAHKQLPELAELQGFGHLKPNQVTLGYKTGEAAMAFLKDEYGQDKLHDLLFTMKDHFDVSTALEALLGCDLKRFDFRFHEWLEDKYAGFIKSAQSPMSYGPKLTQSSDNIPQFNEAPVVSLDGKKIYYFSDSGGPNQVYVFDVASGAAQPLIPLRYRLYENLHTRGRAMSLSKDGRWLAFAGEKEQRDFLYFYDLQRRRLKRVKIPFDELRNPVFSPVNNDELVCVGMTRGFNDLYIINRSGNVVARLTDSPQDERDPVFTSDGQSVVFSGEVVTQDLSDPAGRDIFSINIQTKQVQSIVSQVGSEIEPEVLPDGSLVYVRDRDDNGELGFNLCRHDAVSGNEERLTNFIGGGFSPRYSAVNNVLYYVGFNSGEKHLYRFTEDVIASEAKQSRLSQVKDEIASSLDGAPRNDMRKKTQAPFAWPTDSNSPLFSGIAKPYRFKASTDLFIPFFFYSTLDGLVLIDQWQFSELLGNHQFQQQMQYASGSNFIDLALFYTYARFRPQFSLGFRGAEFYRDFEKQQQRRELNGIGLVNYPLDRITSVSLGFGATSRDDAFLDESEADAHFQDRFLLTQLQYDTVTGRYLVPTKGNRFAIFFQEGINRFGGDQEYKTGGAEAVNYVPIPRESTFASRLFYGRSVGEDAQVFRLGGVDRIRSLPADSLSTKKSNVVLGSGELRLRIKYLNARTKFLFPDFFFKAAYLIVFDDAGYAWDTKEEREAFKANRLENSAGLGISWPTFILQSFKLDFTIQWARRTTTGNDIWYITVGPSF